MRVRFLKQSVVLLTALLAGVALAVAVSAYAANSSTTTASTATQGTTATQTVTQPAQTQTQTVTQPAKTVTQSQTVTQPAQTTTTSTQAPTGAAVAAGAAGAKASEKGQSEEEALPTWAWVLIGAGVICAIVAAFALGRRRSRTHDETSQSVSSDASGAMSSDPPPSDLSA